MTKQRIPGRVFALAGFVAFFLFLAVFMAPLTTGAPAGLFAGGAVLSSVGAGPSWGSNVKVNDDSENNTQNHPAIAATSSGNAHAVWYDRRNDGWGDIYYAYRPAAGPWGANSRADDGPASTTADAPHIAVDSSGNAYALWRDVRSGTSGDVYFSYRPSAGAWGASVRVDDASGSTDVIDPCIAAKTKSSE